MSSKIFVKVETALEQQENLRNARKSLKVLQRVSTDKENLIGRQPIGGPQKAFVKSKSENDFNNDTGDIKRKKLANSHAIAAAATAAATASIKQRRSSELLRITEEDLTDTTGEQLSEGYWRELAEKRRIALETTLTENQELHELNASLKEQLDVSNQMLDESRNLVEVLTEMLEEGEAAGTEQAGGASGSGQFERGESSRSFLHASLAEEAAEVEGVRYADSADDESCDADDYAKVKAALAAKQQQLQAVEEDGDDEASREGFRRNSSSSSSSSSSEQ